MGKKVIISETTLKRFAAENMLNEASDKLNEKELIEKLKASLKSDTKLKSELEKKVKDLVAGCVNNLFKTLWLRRSYYEDEIKR